MIALLVVLGVVVAVYRAVWFVDLVAGAALLSIPLALVAGRVDVAATGAALLALTIWKMAQEA